MSRARRVDLKRIRDVYVGLAAIGLLVSAAPLAAAAPTGSDPALLVSVSSSAGDDAQKDTARVVCLFFAEQRRADGSITDCFPVSLPATELGRSPAGLARGGHSVVLPHAPPVAERTLGVSSGMATAARVPPGLTGTRNTAIGPTVVAIEASIDVVPESVGSVSLSIRRFCPVEPCDTGPASVDYRTVAGSATEGGNFEAGSDFIGQQGSLNWGSGELSTRTVEILIVDDTEHEPDVESFSVELFNPDGPELSPGLDRAVIEIEDDDPPSEPPPSPPTPTEVYLDLGADVVPEDVGAITVTVRRECADSACSVEAATVDYATESGSAVAGADFGAVSGRLSWAAEELAPRSFIIPIVDDEEHEVDVESFRVVLRNARAEAGAGMSIRPGGGELFVEIADDDPSGGGIRFVTSSLSVGETAGAATFHVVRSGGSSGRASVTVRAGGGSAETGDFGAASPATLVWADREAGQKSVSLAVFEDDDFDDETVILTLGNPVGARLLSPATATLAILDDDEDPGQIAFARRERSVSEDRGSLEISVRRTVGSSGSVSVGIAIEGEAEDVGLPEPSRLEWADGELAKKSFVLPIVADNLQEDDETVILRLAGLDGPPGVRLGDPDALMVTIRENDQPAGLVAYETETEITAEVDDRVRLEVRLSDAQERPVKGASVRWRLDPEGPPEGGSVGELLAGCEEGQGAQLTGPVETDGNGLAGACVRVLRAGEIEVEAASSGVAVVTFSISARLFVPKPDDPDEFLFDDDEAPVALVLAEVCSVKGISAELRRVCDDLAQLKLDDPLGLRAALDALSIDDHSSQADASRNAGASQKANLLARIASIKSGAAGLGIEQLAFDIRGRRLPGTVLAGLLRPADDRGEESRVLARVLPHPGPWAWEAGELGGESLSPRDLRRLLAPHEDHVELDLDFDLESSPGEETSPGAQGGQASDPIADEPFVRPLQFFVNGTIALGDRPSTDTDTGFDFETAGLSFGADYRFSDSLFVGGALGYVSSDSELANGSRLDTVGVSVGVFALYSPTDHLAIDGLAIYGRNRLEMDRFVDFPGRPARVRGDPDGDQISLGLGAGYDRNLGPWSLGGFGHLSYLEAKVDAYEERGVLETTGYELRIGGQELTSLVSRIGLNLDYALSRVSPALMPGLSVSYLHEFEDDGRLLTASFVGDPRASPAVFAIPTEEPDRDYFSAAVSLVALLRCDRRLWFSFEQDLERSDLDYYMVRAEFRFTLGGCKKAIVTSSGRSASGGGARTGE